MVKQKIVVMSLGGSIVVPDEIDYVFLENLKKLLHKFNYKFIIVVGGGKTARKYIEPLKKAGLSNEQQDWIGIEVTRLNAKLVSLFFGLHQEIPKTIFELIPIFRKHKISIIGGIKPGTTTDGIAALAAERVKASFLINMTNVKGLYNKDPSKHKDAKLIKSITYTNLKRIMPKEEAPGQHFILDKLALKTIEKHKIKAFIINKDLKNLENLLKSRKFEGSLIF